MLGFKIPRPPEFRFQFPVIPLSVVDGDTVDCVVDQGFGGCIGFRCRLADIDAPEMRGKNASPAGREATAFVRQWFDEREGQPFTLFTEKGHPSTVGIGDGSFGRWLGNFVDGAGDSLADALVGAGFAERGFMPS